MPRSSPRSSRARLGLLLLSLSAAIVPSALPASAAPTTVRGERIRPVERSSFVMRDLAATSAPAHLLPPGVREEEAAEGEIPHSLPVPPGVPIQGPSEPHSTEAPPPPDPEAAAPPTLAASFRAVDDDISSIPPDTNGAVGPSHVLTTLNNLVRVQTRTGAILSTVTLEAFWNDSGVFDPRAQYDPYHGRFITVATVDAGAANAGVVVAASATSDPTGTWYRFRFLADPASLTWCDFPNLAFTPKWLAVTCNMFTNTANTFSRVSVFLIDRAAVYANAVTPGATRIDLSNHGGSLAPAITYDATLGTLHLIQSWNGNSGGNGYVRLYTVTGILGSEALTVGALIGVPAPWHYGGGLGDFAPQQGDARKINLVDDRMLAVYRNGSLWATQTVFLPASSPTRAAVQWWQVEPTGATVTQRGRLDGSATGKSYGFPSIAVNASGDTMVGYSSFSATQYASAAFAVRYAGDPVNTLQADTLLKGGEAPYFKTYGGGRNRWGDYSATTVDPVNDHDFWTIQEWAWTPSPTLCDPPEVECDRFSTWWGKVVPNSAVAIVSPSPSSLTFGSQRVFTQSSQQPVTVTNTGSAATTLGTLTVGGANPSDFSLQSNTCNGATLAAGASCSFAARFAPSASGPRSASVSIPSSAPGGAVSVPMSGTGVAPIVSINPTSVSFGTQRVATTSTQRTVTVTNTGTDTLTISATSLAGTHAADFAIAANTCVGATLAGGGGSCAVGLTFTPATTGTRSAALALTHDGAGSSSSVPLSGTGALPGVTLTPSSVDFGNVLTGSTSAPRSVTLSNSGSVSLAVSTLTLTGTNASAYALSSNACSGASLAPGATCTFGVTFSPVADGPTSAAVEIVSDAPSSPTLLPLSGAGSAASPAISLTPSSVAFGDQIVSTTSAPRPVTITNTGTATLTLGTLSLSGVNVSDFALMESCSGTQVAPAGTCTAQVTFSPSAFGTRTATLQVPSDASGSPHAASLSGNGIGSGVIAMNPSPLGFGGQVVGTTSAPRSLTITNTGSGPLTIHSLSLGGTHASNYAVSSDPCTGVTLAAAQACQLMLTFTPSATGARSATLTTASTASVNPVLQITGTGTLPKLGTDKASIAFGTGAVGQTSPTQSLVVTNTGSGTLGPIGASLAGAHAGDFAIVTNGCTAAYGAGQSCTLNLRATPSGDGVRSGSLVLTSNDPSGPKNVALQAIGDGTAPTSTITTGDMSFLLGNLQSFSGGVTDERAGVAELAITYRNLAGPPTVVKPSLDCNIGNTVCTWRVVAPLVPGIYTVNARGRDLVGNQEDPGPTITVVVI